MFNFRIWIDDVSNPKIYKRSVDRVHQERNEISDGYKTERLRDDKEVHQENKGKKNVPPFFIVICVAHYYHLPTEI